MRICLILTGVTVLIAFASAEHHVKIAEHHPKTLVEHHPKTSEHHTKTVEHHAKTAEHNKNAELADQKTHHVKKSGKKYNHDHERTQKGKSEVVLHKKEDVEKGGKKHHSIDEGSHHAQNHQQGHGAHGAAYKTGNHQKKTGFERGFREQYHKDEQKKSDSWFSNKHKSGEWLKYGSGKSKHHVVKHDKDSNGKYHVAKHGDKHGKEQKFAGGHDKADHKGHQSQHGAQTHYSKHEEYGKKKIHPKH